MFKKKGKNVEERCWRLKKSGNIKRFVDIEKNLWALKKVWTL